MKKIPRAISCSKAIAEAVRLCKPAVVAAYPITPQTLIVEELAKMHAERILDCEFVNAESEHSALSICIGAQATGSRTFTATSSQGLALMHEMLFIASGLRLPIVMVVANRALSAPINIWCDHSDTMASRDSGWLQFYCESVQEAHDTVIQAYKIAESVLLPAMVCIDGFTLSHVTENAELIKNLKNFLPPYKPCCKLDPSRPITIGAIVPPEFYFEFKMQQQKAMLLAQKTIKKINLEFKKRFYRSYGDGLIETFNLEKAKKAIIALGSQCSTIKYVINLKKNTEFGLIRLKCFRPFPGKELVAACENIEEVYVIDRAISFGNGAPLYTEVKATLPEKIKVKSYLIGIGGQDVSPEIIKKLIK
ncbi:MAG: pyruvate ferredoxin oxidoreductase [Candidatus Pacearchaeota archaeon]|nr:pyruvate ferredoxin oxidoreductase [Candidatus Pacearchaeota archaeon]